MNTIKQRLDDLEKAAPKPPEPEPLAHEQVEAEVRHTLASCEEIIDYASRGWLRWNKSMRGDSDIPQRESRPGRENFFLYDWWFSSDCPREYQDQALRLAKALFFGIEQWSLRTGERQPDTIPECITWLEMVKGKAEEWLDEHTKTT
jgi:hypothetical protein